MNKIVNLLKNKIQPYLERKLRLFFYRRMAHRLINKIVQKRGYQIVDRQIKKTIKSYAKRKYGSSRFWPWLALYTEVQGEFIEGWLPSDYYMAYLLKKYNPESIRISAHKTFDNKIFPDFALKPLVLKIGATFYNSNRRLIERNEAENILFNFDDEVVLKEDLGMGGHNVNFIESRELNFDNYSHLSNYTIQPVVRQHENLRALNNKSINTLRVLTYRNEDGSIDIKYTLLRFGTGDSRVDNTSSGGGYCFVKSNGNLEDIAYSGLGTEMEKKHPDSETPFKSVVIPNYENVIEKCISSHKMFPYFMFIGWDVAVNRLGEPILLEWNENPDLWQAEAIKGPFFKDEIMEGRFTN